MKEKQIVLTIKSLRVPLIGVVFLGLLPLAHSQQSFTEISYDKSSRLSFHLDSIESNAQKRRYKISAVKLGLSGLLGVGSVLSTKMNEPKTVKKISTFSLATGATLLGVSGLWTFFTPSDFEILPLQYRQMTEQNDVQLRAKITAGEIYLKRLASKEKKQRLMHIAGYSFLGASQLALYYSSHHKKENAWLFYQGALFSGMGLFQLLRKDTILAELRAYEKGLHLSASLFFN